jgi:hypothetical protein
MATNAREHTKTSINQELIDLSSLNTFGSNSFVVARWAAVKQVAIVKPPVQPPPGLGTRELDLLYYWS